MASLIDVYKDAAVKNLMQKFKYKNVMQVPRIKKIVVNVGMGAMAHEKELVELVREELSIITGQKPMLARSKKAISNFKIREGVPVGYKVTLRGKRMYEFLYKLINFCIPRIRDFRGVSRTAFDGDGNYTLGVKEQSIFPELDVNKVAKSHGMDICIVTSAGTKEESFALLEELGMPFSKK
ncbi:MAG: 50S ribosomal protein L5 [Candidatus Omnitrophica bacterium]|nr:50S ribosomal protein L5 [Candidatus Omnitrophota bacterium]